MTATARGFRRVVRAQRLLAELGLVDPLEALAELREARALLAELTPAERARLEAKVEARRG